MLHCARLPSRPSAVNSSRHHDRAKNPRLSAMGSKSTRKPPGIAAGVNFTSHHRARWKSPSSSFLDDPRCRNGNDESPTELPIFILLGQDLVSEVPGQEQH